MSDVSFRHQTFVSRSRTVAESEKYVKQTRILKVTQKRRIFSQLTQLIPSQSVIKEKPRKRPRRPPKSATREFLQFRESKKSSSNGIVLDLTRGKEAPHAPQL